MAFFTCIEAPYISWTVNYCLHKTKSALTLSFRVSFRSLYICISIAYSSSTAVSAEQNRSVSLHKEPLVWSSDELDTAPGAHVACSDARISRQ